MSLFAKQKQKKACKWSKLWAFSNNADNVFAALISQSL